MSVRFGMARTVGAASTAVLLNSVKNPIGFNQNLKIVMRAKGCKPFGRVMGSHGEGSNSSGKADGELCRNVAGACLYGPLLAKTWE